MTLDSVLDWHRVFGGSLGSRESSERSVTPDSVLDRRRGPADTDESRSSGMARAESAMSIDAVTSASRETAVGLIDESVRSEPLRDLFRESFSGGAPRLVVRPPIAPLARPRVADELSPRRNTQRRMQTAPNARTMQLDRVRALSETRVRRAPEAPPSACETPKAARAGETPTAPLTIRTRGARTRP